MLDEGGVDALNMRAVADRLGTGPSSLYAHFAGKDELLAAMIDRIAGELPIAEVGNGPWQEQLKDAIRAIRAGLAAHRDLARAALGNIPTGPNALRWVNGLLGVLRDAGLPDHVIAYAVDILPLYAHADRLRGIALHAPRTCPTTARSTSPSCASTSRRCRPTASRTSSPWRSR